MACTAALLTAAACSNDIFDVAEQGNVKIMLTANVGNTTRTTHTALNQDHIATGDGSVGVIIQQEGASSGSYLLNNAAHSSDGAGSLTPVSAEASPYFPLDGSRVNIYAYTPRITSDTFSPDDEITVSVATDQSSDNDYLSSDFMIGAPTVNPVAKTTSAIPLTFEHKMAKIIVDFSGVTTDLTGATLTTCDLFTSAKVHIKTNHISTDETASKQPITIAKIDDNKKAACVIPPQTVAAGTKLLCISYPIGIKRYYTLGQETTFESGNVYTFNMSNVNINSVDLGSLSGDITLTGDCILTGTTSNQVTIPAGANVVLKDVTIDNQIVCAGDANIYIIGTNKVTCTDNYQPGIKAGPSGTTLTIDGDDDAVIDVKGGKRGAGIGSESEDGLSYASCGNITISGGTVTAIGGESGAGIGGGGGGSSCGNIVIDMTNAGNYSLMARSNRGICIGKEDYGGSTITITITNAEITLDDSNSSAQYFDPTPTFEGTVVIKDKDGNDITSSITHN